MSDTMRVVPALAVLEDVPSPTAAVLVDVLAERARHHQLERSGEFNWMLHETVDDSGRISDDAKLTVLLKNVGDLARVIRNEHNGELPEEVAHLVREELIEVAAACIAWCEAIDWEEEAESEE